MVFSSEADFEEAVIQVLKDNGWDDAGGVIKYPTEQDLIQNWANILFENNNTVDRLNGQRLTEGEMRQIIEQVETLRTPFALNGFINGKTISIKRDNPADTLHHGKEISLKIYDRQEIAAGQSRYQIVQQPQFPAKKSAMGKRRGDLMLLINGMPVFHLELKGSKVPLSNATNQIRTYLSEGVFTGIFSLVQIFVAMTPEETRYFANPGSHEKMNKAFFFQWADFNNEPITDWKKVTSNFLNIPLAHQLIGFYTIADSDDGALKVMRSYQYFASSRISDKVAKAKWGEKYPMGGYIWHTTGSGKTMTSFKSAQLIASSRDADKVVFLLDRIELGLQSLKEYRAFADDKTQVQATENADVLLQKLLSDDPSNTLIVTSIQKISNITSDTTVRDNDIKKIAGKRVVFIIDECHRSTFGKMLADIRRTFPFAMLFGFTGTPIHEENSKKLNTTTSVFGDELHRYSIADGIRDRNVLGFDKYKVLTYKDNALRVIAGLRAANASSVEEARSDEKKEKIFESYQDTTERPMAGYTDDLGAYHEGVEDQIPRANYESEGHRQAVVSDILEKWDTYSKGGKFHAILATSSINEAIEYYYQFRRQAPEFAVSALFDPHVDFSSDNDDQLAKQDGMIDIIEDYNARYNKSFDVGTHAAMKKDISARLAHKSPYNGIEKKPEEQLQLLIVVDQMLTGYDSKWVNTLYLDKVLVYENLIQAISRTNRLLNEDKKFGIIRYYRKPHTMERNIEDAVRLYSGDKPFGMFVSTIDEHLRQAVKAFEDIKAVYAAASCDDFASLPEEKEARQKFAKSFRELNNFIESAKLQGFDWSSLVSSDEVSDGGYTVEIPFTEQDYLTLTVRYQELIDIAEKEAETAADDEEQFAYDLDPYITDIDTGHIDSDYMNANFTKYLKALEQGLPPEELQQLLSELHRSFAYLSQEEQKYADIFLRDVQSGDIVVSPDKSFRMYITEYMERAKNRQVSDLVSAFGLDQERLMQLMGRDTDAHSIDEYGYFERLKETVDKKKARAYLEEREGQRLTPPKVSIGIDKFLRKFIQAGGFDVYPDQEQGE